MTSDQKSHYLKSIRKNFASLQQQVASGARKRQSQNAIPRASTGWSLVCLWIVVLASAATVVYAIRTMALMKAQFNLLQKQLQTNAETFEAGDRPWIEIEPLKPLLLYSEDESPTGAGFRYDVYLKNTGKSMAHGITARTISQFADRTLADDVRSIQKLQDELRPVQTQSSESIPSVVTSNRVPAVLAPGAVSPVPFILRAEEPHDGRRNFLIGRIDYADASNAGHWITFCFAVANRSGQLVYCSSGNNQDHNSR